MVMERPRSEYILDGHEPRLAESWDEVVAFFRRGGQARRVAEDQVGDAWVSTVFLTVDHGFGRGRPILFETMIFGGQRDEECRRYSTWAEAEAGHRRAVAELRAAADALGEALG